MNEEIANMMAEWIRRDIDNNQLHYGDVEVCVVETVGCGWMVQIY